MKILLLAGLATIGALFAFVLAPLASADTSSVVKIGNDQLGYSLGTSGGSVAFGGVRTTVDGFGTLHGSTTVTQGGKTLFGINQSYNNGFQSTTTLNNGQYTQTTEGYYNGQWEWSGTSPGGSFGLVCTPTGGCHSG